MSFTARYDSICPLCGDEIVADVDEISTSPDGYAHTDCADRDRADRSGLTTFDL